MFIEEKHFSRPLVPFTCFNEKLYQFEHANKSTKHIRKFNKRYNTCGDETDRVPTRSCSIDFNFRKDKYNFEWSNQDATAIWKT